MISAKLYILGEERELLWISTNYFKGTRADGSLTSEVNGGLLTLSFVSQENDELFLENMTKKKSKMKQIEWKKAKYIFLRMDSMIYQPKNTNLKMPI